jgi:hypothetical protein
MIVVNTFSKNGKTTQKLKKLWTIYNDNVSFSKKLPTFKNWRKIANICYHNITPSPASQDCFVFVWSPQRISRKQKTPLWSSVLAVIQAGLPDFSC